MQRYVAPEHPPPPLGGPLGGLVSLPPGRVMILHGPPGSGKTSLALAAFEHPWICTSEMPPDELTRYAVRLGTRPVSGSQITIAQLDDGTATVDLGIDVSCHTPPGPDLVVDSATSTGLDVDVVRMVHAYALERHARAIVILHETKAGAAWGSSALTFDAWACAGVDKRVANVWKNRSGPIGSVPFSLTAQGIGPPRWRGYYSIEGDGPAYRAVRWPRQRDAPHADVYRAAEGKKLRKPLPRAPVAVCAIKVFGQWSAPDDLADREAWAARAGLPMWHPVAFETDDDDDKTTPIEG